MNAQRRHHRSDRGASLAEYGLLVGLVAVVAVAALGFLGRSADASLERAAGHLSGGPSSGGDSSGGDPSGGDSSGGDPSGGESSGGDSTGGDSTGGDSTGGDSTGGDSTGGDSTGGDSTGGDSTGDDSSGGNEPGSSEPPATTRTNGTGSASRHGNKWNSEATFTIYGTDGNPLDLASVQAQVEVMWTYTTWDGRTITQEYKTTQAEIDSDGTVTFADRGFETKPGHNVTSVSYQIVDVFYYWPSNPPIKWDGEKAFVQIDAP